MTVRWTVRAAPDQAPAGAKRRLPCLFRSERFENPAGPPLDRRLGPQRRGQGYRSSAAVYKYFGRRYTESSHPESTAGHRRGDQPRPALYARGVDGETSRNSPDRAQRPASARAAEASRHGGVGHLRHGHAAASRADGKRRGARCGNSRRAGPISRNAQPPRRADVLWRRPRAVRKKKSDALAHCHRE